MMPKKDLALKKIVKFLNDKEKGRLDEVKQR